MANEAYPPELTLKVVNRFVLSQGGADTTQIAAASSGNRHKVVGAVLTISALGTAKFIDGSGDLTGAFDLGAASTPGGFVLPISVYYPWFQTALTSALSIVTTAGAAKGLILYVTEP